MTSLAKFFLLTAFLTITANAGEWIALFDGKSLTGWAAPNGAAPGPGWKIVDGTLHLDGRGGNIVAPKEYSSFELTWTWKIAKGGNNGIKYWVEKVGNDWLGPEYQMIDDSGHPDALISKKRSTACLYDIKAADEGKVLKPVGEWNESRIIVRNGIIEHHLNGKMVIQQDTRNDEWKELIEQSKFKEKLGYASGKGRIMITDHGDKTWFRDIRIREL